ncbi:hypothetical protein SKB0068_16650 [Staphylococcus hominis subsp. novobiosepticus]
MNSIDLIFNINVGFTNTPIELIIAIISFQLCMHFILIYIFLLLHTYPILFLLTINKLPSNLIQIAWELHVKLITFNYS